MKGPIGLFGVSMKCDRRLFIPMLLSPFLALILLPTDFLTVFLVPFLIFIFVAEYALSKFSDPAIQSANKRWTCNLVLSENHEKTFCIY